MIEVFEEDKGNIKGLKYIDLFAGIGGFRTAFDSFGAKCVYSSEWDKHAQQVYKANYGDLPDGDITKVDEKTIPQHDILCGGFPCQAFSISGKQKGFEDTRGTLFFDVARIAKYHQPKIMLLENVANFEKHDSGKTLKVVLKTLDDIGYNVKYKVLNASDYSVPQNRERIFIVCFRKDIDISRFEFPRPEESDVCVKNIALPDSDTEKYIIHRDDIRLDLTKAVPDMFGKYPSKPIRVGTVNKGGQGERIYYEAGHAITLSAYGGGVGAKTGLYLINDKIRKLAPRECARLQGFPDTFIMDENQNQAYKQFGNGVVVDVLQKIIKQINLAV